MTKLLPQYKRSTVYALIGAIFHFVVVVLPLLIMGLGGLAKGYGWLVYFFDFPLVLLDGYIRALRSFVYASKIGYVLYYSVCGTVLYALLGWLAGYLKDK